MWLAVRRALKFVIDPAILIHRDDLFHEELAVGIWRVHVILTNELRSGAARFPRSRFVDDKHIEIAIAPLTARVKCSEGLIAILFDEVRCFGRQRLGLLLRGVFRVSRRSAAGDERSGHEQHDYQQFS